MTKFYMFGNKIIALLLCIMLLFSFAGCGNSNTDTDPETTPEVNESVAPVHEPITEELIAILEANPTVKALLQKSIDAAKKINPDKKTENIQQKIISGGKQNVNQNYPMFGLLSRSIWHLLLQHPTILGRRTAYK